MKRTMTHWILALFIAATLVACGSDEDDTRATTTTEPAEAPAPATPMETKSPMAMDDSDDMDHGDMDHEGDMMGEDAAENDTTGDSMAGDAESGDPCDVTIEAGDTLAYDRDSISVPSSCESVTVTFNHTGQLPATAMGHNWVLVPSSAVQEIGNAGMTAGAENNYVPEDDRIVASTELIGGGETTSVTFSLSDLAPDTDYTYVCTFPGHWAAMQGSFTVE